MSAAWCCCCDSQHNKTRDEDSGTCKHGHSEILLLQNHPLLACSPAHGHGTPHPTNNPARLLLSEQADKRPVAKAFSARLRNTLSQATTQADPRPQSNCVSTTVGSQGRDHTSIQNWRSLRTAGARWGNWEQDGSARVSQRVPQLQMQ
jgi:hypothetical protein